MTKSFGMGPKPGSPPSLGAEDVLGVKAAHPAWRAYRTPLIHDGTTQRSRGDGRSSAGDREDGLEGGVFSL